LFEIFFNEVPANANLASDIENTFKQGGWYRYDLDDVMILSLNGMYPFYSNQQDKYMAEEMINWVRTTLEDN
jgi:hypothetical protein